MNAQESNERSDKVVDSIRINDVEVPLIFEKSANLPVGNVQLMFIGGSADAKTPGLAALSARILNQGTKTLGNVEFAKRLDNKAISIQAGAGLQLLSFEISYLKEFSNDAFELFAMLLKDPNFTQDAFDKSKSLMLNKLAQKEDDFDEIAEENLKKILFKGTPVAVPLSGDVQSVKSITLSDVKDFLARNLVLSRLIIVAGGDMDKQEFTSKLSSTLSILPIGEGKDRLRFKTSSDVDSITIKKPTKQAFIYFGAPFDVSDASKNYIARVMSFILGGSGFGSRMMEEVRVKRGLAYSASMGISVGGSVDYASGHLQTKLESKDEAIAVVREVVADFIKNGATEAELQAAKAFLLGSEPLGEETLSQRLNTAFSNYFRGLPLDNRKRELKAIQALTLEELNAYITAHKEILQLSFSIVDGE